MVDVSVAARPRVVGHVRPPFLAHDVGFTPGGRRVWVTSGDRGRIAIYEAATARLVRTLAADAPPQHVTFLDDRAFVTSGDDAILRIHALDGRLLRSAPVPGGLLQRAAGLRADPDAVALAGDALHVQRARRAARAVARRPLVARRLLRDEPVMDLPHSRRSYSQRMAAGRDERAYVRAAQRGSASGIEALFRLHWPRAYRAAYLVVHDAAAAEDIAQEAFLAAVRNLDRFDRGRPFGPWLHRIVVNRAIDWTRARQLRGEAELGDSLPAAEQPAELGDSLLGALAALPPEHRAVIVLRHLLEYTPGEIAELLGLPRGTVNSRLRRGLDSLKEQV